MSRLYGVVFLASVWHMVVQLLVFGVTQDFRNYAVLGVYLCDLMALFVHVVTTTLYHCVARVETQRVLAGIFGLVTLALWLPAFFVAMPVLSDWSAFAQATAISLFMIFELGMIVLLDSVDTAPGTVVPLPDLEAATHAPERVAAHEETRQSESSVSE